MSDQIDLGPCCACGQASPTVRNIAMLPVRAPVPGTGWGCFVCNLPSNGAIAVLCDDCLGSRAPIADVCHGYPGEGVRMVRAALTEPFDHDEEKHRND